MAEIRRATPEDFGRMVELTTLEGWNYSHADFAALDQTGCATTLAAVFDGRIIGMITLMDYGEVGWISNILVARSHRGRGLGEELLGEGVDRLGRKQSIALFSYKDAVGFYQREGFKLEGEYCFVRYLGGYSGRGSVDGLGLGAVAPLDLRAFSMKRDGLLEMLLGKGRVLVPPLGGGFALTREDPVEPTVGPVVCEDASAGRDLLYAAFDLLGAGAVAVLVGGLVPGVEEMGRVSRLYLGEPPRTDGSKALAFAGLEFG